MLELEILPLKSYKLFCEQYSDLCSRSTFGLSQNTSKFLNDIPTSVQFVKARKKFAKIEKNPSLAEGLLKDTYEDAKFHVDLVKKRNNDFTNNMANLKEHSCILIMVIFVEPNFYQICK